MAQQIKKVAVLGSGVMGSGIAAHLAGVGLKTMLLDIVPPELTPEEIKAGLTRDDQVVRNRFGRTNLEKASKSKVPAFYNTDDAARIFVGNFEDHFDKISDCDWIIEAVVENIDIKRDLFAKLEMFRRPGAWVTSNTSGLSIKDMTAGRSDDFRQHFCVTHFFNPVRFMRLLELVAGEETDKEAFAALAKFGADRLGKGIVFGKDTPNFVANRIGVYSMMSVLHYMEREGLSLEEIDAVFGPATGRPKSAVFRTADMVGLDTLVHVADHCYQALTSDECRETFRVPEWLREMIKRGYLGGKTKGGFYKKDGDKIFAIDIKTLEYRPSEKVKPDSVGAAKGFDDVGQRVKAMCNYQDHLGKLAWEITAGTLIYSARRLGEIADDVVNCDRAMQWGFNWDLGPFASWDALGLRESVERMQHEGKEVPPLVTQMLSQGQNSFYGGTPAKPTYFDIARKEYVDVPIDSRQVRLAVLREENRIVKDNPGATLFDAGDGVLLLEFHTKMNAVDDDIIAMIHESITLAEDEGWNGLVIANENKEVFSAGANIFAILMAIKNYQWEALEKLIGEFQQATLRLRYSDIPVVAAPAGLTLGGGCEITMGADAVQAHAETYMGLVEIGVGVIPAGGGCLDLIERFCGQLPDDPALDPMPFLKQAMLNIGMAKVSIGAEDARKLGMLRPTDGITLNRDLLIHDAKQRVLGLTRAGYRQPRPMSFRLPGESGAAGMRWFGLTMLQGNQITEHEYKILGKLAHVLCGGNTTTRQKVSQQQILDLEREAFLSLCGEEKTQERIQHMLSTNKPLRN